MFPCQPQNRRKGASGDCSPSPSPLAAGLVALDILGWCLMTNYVHLLAVPRQRAALARVMMRMQYKVRTKMVVEQHEEEFAS